MLRLFLVFAFLPSLSLHAAPTLDQVFADIFERLVRSDPEFATSVGRHEWDDRWTDLSPDARKERRAILVDGLKALQSFDPAKVPPQDRVSLKLFQYDWKLQLEAEELETHLYRVGQLFGFHNSAYLTIDVMPAFTVHDYENIVARIRALPRYVDQNIDVMNEAIHLKIMQSKLVTDLVLGQIATQLKQKPEESGLLEPFRHFPGNISQADRARLLQEATDAYQQQFVPAWRKLHDYMANTYAQNVRASDSLSSMPNGKADYALLIRHLTTTDLSAEQIHKLGLSEVNRIEAEMTRLVRAQGFQGTLGQYEKKLEQMPEQHFRSKDDMLIYCRNAAKIIEPELPKQFGHIPLLLYGVRPIPADREAATATNAQAPTPDFKIPGWFNLNTYEPEKQVKYDKEALVLHEAVPGHIFQITLAQSQGNLPLLRKFYFNSAFAEGWALYVESIGKDLGLYKDPNSQFGQLASERFRAVRLVVDTGIHQSGWTRGQAIAYFQEHAPDEPVSEIDRYISWPAQALSYKMGQLRIRQLRTAAEKQLGGQFDVRAFHDAVLENGTLPLAILSETVAEKLHLTQ